jgi:hypothetical protein
MTAVQRRPEKGQPSAEMKHATWMEKHKHDDSWSLFGELFIVNEEEEQETENIGSHSLRSRLFSKCEDNLNDVSLESRFAAARKDPSTFRLSNKYPD